MALLDPKFPLTLESMKSIPKGMEASKANDAGVNLTRDDLQRLLKEHTEEIKETLPKGGRLWSIAAAAATIIAAMVILVEKSDKTHPILYQSINASLEDNALIMKELLSKVKTLNGDIEGLRQSVHFQLLENKLQQEVESTGIINSSD